MKRHKTYYLLSTVCFLWFLNVFVIKQSVSNTIAVEDVQSNNQKRDYYGDTEKLLIGYQKYGNNIRLARWNQSIVEINVHQGYHEEWARILKMLRLPPGCNAVDIGANDGVDGDND